jgi:hypothetical protein
MLIYTFRTFPYISELEENFRELFVFSKLKEDWVSFEKLLSEQPDKVLGVAQTDGPSREEPIAINRFNLGTVIRGGVERLELHTSGILPPAQKPTHTFCNWTMYHTQNYINQHNPQTKFSFIHINKNDLNLLGTFSRQLQK